MAGHFRAWPLAPQGPRQPCELPAVGTVVSHRVRVAERYVGGDRLLLTRMFRRLLAQPPRLKIRHRLLSQGASNRRMLRQGDDAWPAIPVAARAIFTFLFLRCGQRNDR